MKVLIFSSHTPVLHTAHFGDHDLGCSKSWALQRAQRKNLSEASPLMSVNKVSLLCGCESPEYDFIMLIVLRCSPCSLLRDRLYSPQKTRRCGERLITLPKATPAQPTGGGTRPWPACPAAWKPQALAGRASGSRARQLLPLRPAPRAATSGRPCAGAPTPRLSKASAAAGGGTLSLRRPKSLGERSTCVPEHLAHRGRVGPQPAGRRRAVSDQALG